MTKKKDNSLYIMIGIIVLIVVIVYGSQNGWFNFVSQTYITNSYENIYDTKNIKPNEIAEQPIKTCQQIATENNAFFIESMSLSKECLNYAIIDCQQKAKIIDGYGLSGTCCYYTCVEPVVSCVKTDDSSYAIFGTCSDSDTPYIEDYCLGGQLREQTCQENKCVEVAYWCPNGRVCDFGKCVSI